MKVRSRARDGAAWLLDVLAVAAVAWTAKVMAGSHGPLLPTGVVAQALAAVPGLLLLRTIAETRSPFWARWAFSETAGPTRLLGGATAGGVATALGASSGWSFVHPHTDYPGTATIALLAVGIGVALAVPAGGLALLWSRLDPRPHRGTRIAFLAASASVGLVVWAWNPVADRVFDSAHVLVAGLAVGAACFVLVGAGLLAVSAPGGTARRVATAAALGAVLVAGFGWLQRPLPGDRQAPDGWPHAVVLVTIDTLRADHLGFHGYHRDTSPRLDALAARSVVFERAYAVMPTTDPSHAAILTGRLPRTTGITRNGQSLAGADVVSLASWLRSHGYRTGAITSRAHLDPASLRLSGFQTHSAPVGTADAEETYRRAASWMARRGDRPFFLWVHFWDPHSPYEPPAEHAARFAAGDPVPYAHGIHPYVERPERHDPAAVRHATALYDAEIRDADAWVGRLLDEAAGRFGAERVLTVLTSDHGETLGEHDVEYRYAFDHGKMLVPHELHVPLVLGWPGRLPAGARVSRAVSNAALLPTLSRLLGDPVEADLEGFADLLAGGETAADPVPPLLVERRSFAGPVHVPFLGAPELGVVAGGWLYVENPERGTFLHDLGQVPAVTGNRLAEQTDRAAALAGALRDLAARHPAAAAVTEDMDPEKIEALRSLGYIQ